MEYHQCSGLLLGYSDSIAVHSHIIILSAAIMGKNATDDIATIPSWYVLVLYSTNMPATSYRSDYLLACSSRVNIYEPAFYLTITYPLTVTQIEIRSVQFPTGMSDIKSLNTSLLEVMIFSKYERVFIRDSSLLTLQIIFDASWASMNIGSK
jgi:hypothetical protein